MPRSSWRASVTATPSRRAERRSSGRQSVKRGSATTPRSQPATCIRCARRCENTAMKCPRIGRGSDGSRCAWPPSKATSKLQAAAGPADVQGYRPVRRGVPGRSRQEHRPVLGASRIEPAGPRIRSGQARMGVGRGQPLPGHPQARQGQTPRPGNLHGGSARHAARDGLPAPWPTACCWRCAPACARASCAG